MLEYTKTVLLKVSFDNKLFEKELRKGIRMLEQEEFWHFKSWCFETFADLHLRTLWRVFQGNADGLSAT